MVKFVIATAMLLVFSAQAQTSQPCGARSHGSLRTEKNYSNLMPSSTEAAALKTTVKGKGVK